MRKGSEESRGAVLVDVADQLETAEKALYDADAAFDGGDFDAAREHYARARDYYQEAMQTAFDAGVEDLDVEVLDGVRFRTTDDVHSRLETAHDGYTACE